MFSFFGDETKKSEKEFDLNDISLNDLGTLDTSF